MTVPEAVEDALPSDNEMILATVAEINPLRIDNRGALSPSGVLGSYIPAVGDPVVVLRQDATLVTLGSSVSGVDATNTINGFNGAPSGDTTASAAYTNLDAVSFAFTKRLESTAVRLDYAVSCYSTGAGNTKPQFGVDFISAAGTVYRFDVLAMLINPVSTHMPMSAMVKLPGIPAGQYTVQAIWLRVSGAGTLTVDAEDWVSLMASEVA